MFLKQKKNEKLNYKNNVCFIIFMILLYRQIMMEFCLRCEKNLNKCQKNYEDKDRGSHQKPQGNLFYRRLRGDVIIAR